MGRNCKRYRSNNPAFPAVSISEFLLNRTSRCRLTAYFDEVPVQSVKLDCASAGNGKFIDFGRSQSYSKVIPARRGID